MNRYEREMVMKELRKENERLRKQVEEVTQSLAEELTHRYVMAQENFRRTNRKPGPPLISWWERLKIRRQVAKRHGLHLWEVL